jgi:hypothetical protein
VSTHTTYDQELDEKALLETYPKVPWHGTLFLSNQGKAMDWKNAR